MGTENKITALSDDRSADSSGAVVPQACEKQDKYDMDYQDNRRDFCFVGVLFFHIRTYFV